MAVVIIDESGDLIVEVTEILEEMESFDNSKITSKTQQFKVSTTVLTKATQTLATMLVNPYWKESDQCVVALGEGRVAVTETWLHVLHNTKSNSDLLLPDLWYLVQAIDYYELDVAKFKDVFAAW